MFGDPWWYTRCFVMLQMKPGELCGKQVLKVRLQLILCTLSLQKTHFSDNYPSFTSRDSSILQEQSTIQRFAGDYPGGRRNQVIAGIRLFPRRMSPPNYLETGKIMVGCKKNIWGALRALAKFMLNVQAGNYINGDPGAQKAWVATHDSWNHIVQFLVIENDWEFNGFFGQLRCCNIIEFYITYQQYMQNQRETTRHVDSARLPSVWWRSASSHCNHWRISRLNDSMTGWLHTSSRPKKATDVPFTCLKRSPQNWQ